MCFTSRRCLTAEIYSAVPVCSQHTVSLPCQQAVPASLDSAKAHPQQQARGCNPMAITLTCYLTTNDCSNSLQHEQVHWPCTGKPVKHAPVQVACAG